MVGVLPDRGLEGPFSKMKNILPVKPTEKGQQHGQFPESASTGLPKRTLNIFIKVFKVSISKYSMKSLCMKHSKHIICII